MKWEKLFATQIVERGYDYYCEGMVDVNGTFKM